jgi:hypothetical protein
VQAQNYETFKNSERRGTSFLKANFDISVHLQLQSSEEQGWFLKKKRTHNFIVLSSAQLGVDWCKHLIVKHYEKVSGVSFKFFER